MDGEEGLDPAPTVPPLRQYVVLLADDNEDFRAMCRVILEQADFRVLDAGSFGAARQYLRDQHVDIVVTDLLMPAPFDGFALIQTVREEYGNDLPIVVISGRSHQKALSMASQFGANATLVKPVDADTLLRVIRSLTGG